MIRLSALFLIVLFSTPSAAQSNLKKARIVTLRGDTLHGYVNYRERTRTPTHFTFKNTASAKRSDYTVRNARNVMIEDTESYERFAVALSMNEVNFTRFDPAVSVVDVIDTVFLKVITTGSRMNLYGYRDKLKERFYMLVPPSATPVELHRSIDRVDENITDLNTYRQELDQMAAGLSTYTPQLKNEIAAVSYSESGLKKIVNAINGVERPAVPVTERMNHKRGRFFAGAGINVTKITYTGKNLLNANGLDAGGSPVFRDNTTRSVSPVVSAGYDLFFHPAVARSFLRMELSATPVRSQVASFYKFPAPYDEELTINYKMSGIFVALTPQLGYALYQQPNLSVNISAGPSLRYAVYKQTFNQDTNKEGPGYSDKTIEDYFELKKLTVVPMAQADILINKKIGVSAGWFVPARLVTNNDDSEMSSVKAGSLHLNARYFFK